LFLVSSRHFLPILFSGTWVPPRKNGLTDVYARGNDRQKGPDSINLDTVQVSLGGGPRCSQRIHARYCVPCATNEILMHCDEVMDLALDVPEDVWVPGIMKVSSQHCHRGQGLTSAAHSMTALPQAHYGKFRRHASWVSTYMSTCSHSLCYENLLLDQERCCCWSCPASSRA
jgi:hypothetical protein